MVYRKLKLLLSNIYRFHSCFLPTFIENQFFFLFYMKIIWLSRLFFIFLYIIFSGGANSFIAPPCKKIAKYLKWRKMNFLLSFLSDRTKILLWLKKLQRCNSDLQEMNLRNDFVYYLLTCVKNADLRPPFNELPPIVPLQNLKSLLVSSCWVFW